MAQCQFRSDDTRTWNDLYGHKTDGAYAPVTGTDAPIDSACTGTINTTALSATNVSFAAGQLILIHQTRGTGAGQWELNKIASYVAGTITLAYPLIFGYVSGAQVLVMPQYSSGSIAGGVTITLKAWDGTVGGIYAKFCDGTFTIAGTLTGTGKGFRGGSDNGQITENSGEGTAGASTATHSANGNAGGGGEAEQGGQVWGNGGSGGNGAAGTAGGVNNGGVGGNAGAASGNAGLTLATFGGAGGAGANSNGENGGPFILIIAKTIVVSGSVVLKGNNGANGNTTGGTAGAGGSALFKGQAVTLGSSLVDASGGIGGTSNYPPESNGKNGAVGRIHADYVTSFSGTTSPTIDSRVDGRLSASDFPGGMI